MFNKNNFCHIASNNRNEKKAGVFVYKTTDNLATVSASGYFNDKIVDINLHDLIIHEWHDPTDRTKVQKNVLCVTERTLDNVGTVVIKTKWEEDIEQTIEDLQEYVDNTFVRKDGTSIMTGPLRMRSSVSFKCAIAPSWDGVGFYKLNDNDSLTLMASMETTDGLCPAVNNTYNLGKTNYKWKDAHIARVITAVINNGYDIAVPVTNSPQTLALKSEVDLAANSGRMITAQGVWYAKMYAATVPPAADDDTNYADFSQTDGEGNPIIVIYERQSGAWVQSETITPPAEYDGYVPITSKIWDIPEQTGQQGGRILWNHQSKEFTPYPLIVSFDGQNITNSTFSNGIITSSTFSGEATLSGTSTAPTPTNASPNNQIATKEYIDSIIAQLDVPDMFDYKWKDCIMNRAGWKEADGNWIDKADAEDAYEHLIEDLNDCIDYCEWMTGTTPYITIYTRNINANVGDSVYSDTSLTTEVGTIESIGSNTITVSGNTYNYSSIGDGSFSSETIAGTTVSYGLANDEHKVCHVSEETDVAAIYTATGVAWYYVVDIRNQKFKLPRINPAKELLTYSAPVVGNGKVLGLEYETQQGTIAHDGFMGTYAPSGNSICGYAPDTSLNGSLAEVTRGTIPYSLEPLSGKVMPLGVSTDATKSGVYSDLSNASGYYAGKKHLYFYVG